MAVNWGSEAMLVRQGSDGKACGFQTDGTVDPEVAALIK